MQIADYKSLLSTDQCVCSLCRRLEKRLHLCVIVCYAKGKLLAGTPEFVRQLSERKFTEYVRNCVFWHFCWQTL